jgi:hypothetical protein
MTAQINERISARIAHRRIKNQNWLRQNSEDQCQVTTRFCNLSWMCRWNTEACAAVFWWNISWARFWSFPIFLLCNILPWKLFHYFCIWIVTFERISQTYKGMLIYTCSYSALLTKFYAETHWICTVVLYCLGVWLTPHSKLVFSVWQSWLSTKIH